MTFDQARWRLRLIYEMTTGYKISEANLEEDQRFLRLKENTVGTSRHR